MVGLSLNLDQISTTYLSKLERFFAGSWLIGIFPDTGLKLVGPALGELAGTDQTHAEWASSIGQLQIVFLLFLALIAVIYASKVWLLGRTVVRSGETWGCGYTAVTPRMQYTASACAPED